MRIWLEEQREVYEEIKKHQARSLLQTNLPQPGLANDMMQVRIVGIRRVDEEVLRYSPYSPNWLPYYELRAQVVKSWKTHYVIWPGDIKLSMKVGEILYLLWIGCKREEGGQEVPSPLIWEMGKQYLITGYFLVVKAPWEEQVKVIRDDPSWERAWLVIKGSECFSLLGDSLTSNIKLGNGYDSVLHVPSLPAARIEEPFEEQVQLLDEEAAYFRLSTYEERIRWAKQRVQDTNLPLWKRQRALAYLHFTYYEEYRDPQHHQMVRQQYPNEEPNLVRARLLSRRIVQYLTYLQGLSEPLLQAFGLRVLSEASAGVGIWWAVKTPCCSALFCGDMGSLSSGDFYASLSIYLSTMLPEGERAVSM